MNPTLNYLILARNTITDATTREVSAIGIFDTLFILKGQDSLTYSLTVLGRLYLNMTGIIPSVQAKIRITDPAGTEVHTELLTATNINADFGVNINATLWLLQFRAEGRYTIDISVSTDDVNFIDLQSPTYFQVKKII